MGRGITIGLVGTLTLFIAMSTASPAIAATPQGGAASEVQPPTTQASIYLGESRGYEISIRMPSPKVALLYAFKAEGEEDSLNAYAQSAYAVRLPTDALKRGLIRASFPSLGKVALRFEPSGERRVHRAQNNCRGKRRVTEYGRFRGTISLEGENGYFRVRARARKGLLERSFRLICRKGHAQQDDRGASLWDYVWSGFEFSYSPGRGAVALLYAVAEEAGQSIGLRAARYEGRSPGAEVQLGVLERRAKMAIGRSVFVESDVPGILTTSTPRAHPASAVLTPPPPFYGEGNFFENSSASHSWSGTLGVALPGLDLPLTGEEFKTSLCVVSLQKAPAGCDFIKPKPVR
jgi:hypothetical protein